MDTHDHPGHRPIRVLLILNPESGHYSGSHVHRFIVEELIRQGGLVEEFTLGPARSQGEVAQIRNTLTHGFDVVIAAGGDGTVSAVASALVHTGIPLAIIPLGTSNVLARELGVPLQVRDACRLIGSHHGLVRLDAMQVGDRFDFTHVGVGLDALMIRSTGTTAKKRFGRLAYVGAGLLRLLAFQPRRFLLRIDGGITHQVRASEILVANVGAMGGGPFRWGPGIRPDDGKLNVCIVRAIRLWHYLRLAWHFWQGDPTHDPRAHYLVARDRVEVDMVSADRPLPVQADGEIIGQTPVHIRIQPGAVQVLVPATATDGCLD